MQSEHRIMPTIEGEEAFDRSALARLCDQLQPYSERVSAVRIGGNDILALLGIRRSRYRTAYDGPLGNVIRDIAGPRPEARRVGKACVSTFRSRWAAYH